MGFIVMQCVRGESKKVLYDKEGKDLTSTHTPKFHVYCHSFESIQATVKSGHRTKDEVMHVVVYVLMLIKDMSA